MAYRFALGGMDCIKDDHGLADQPYAPFQRRLEACVAGVERANRETGGTSGYWPHISAVGEDLLRRLEAAAQAGAAGVLVCPHLVGPAALAEVARHVAGLPVMAHPAFSGSYTQPRHGMTRAFLYGALWRALGADFVIHPNAAGRFSFSEAECQAIHAAARGPQAGHAAAWPTPGGGMQRATLARWVGAYGPDTCFLIGGSLYQHPDGLTAAAAEIHSLLVSSHG